MQGDPSLNLFHIRSMGEEIGCAERPMGNAISPYANMKKRRNSILNNMRRVSHGSRMHGRAGGTSSGKTPEILTRAFVDLVADSPLGKAHHFVGPGLWGVSCFQHSASQLF